MCGQTDCTLPVNDALARVNATIWKMRPALTRARESFWFLPAVLGLGSIVLAQALIGVDRLLIDVGIQRLPLVSDLSATGGRAILSAVGITMLTVAATAFSITISVLATTSTSYGPRLVRNFMADRGNQLVLATLTSSFLYALVVLRSIRTQADTTTSFVPVIAVNFVLILAVADVAVLVYFIHHIARSVQVTTLQKRVLVDLLAVINLVYPDREAEHDNGEQPRDMTALTQTVAAAHGGFVQEINFDALVRLASENDWVVTITATPGSHVIVGEALLELSPAFVELNPTMKKELRQTFTLGDARTPHHDVEFALQQLIEMGVRGLASGANDPYTAVSALDAIAAALVPVAQRADPPPVLLKDGIPRVCCRWPTCEELLSSVFQAMRTYGITHPLVLEALLRFSTRIGRATTAPDRRAALAAELVAVRVAYLSSKPQEADSRRYLPALDEQISQLRS